MQFWGGCIPSWGNGGKSSLIELPSEAMLEDDGGSGAGGLDFRTSGSSRISTAAAAVVNLNDVVEMIPKQNLYNSL